MTADGSRVCLILSALLTDADIEQFAHSDMAHRVDYVVSEDAGVLEHVVRCFAGLASSVVFLPKVTRELIQAVDVLCFVETTERIEWSALEAACVALDAHDDIDAVKCSRSGFKAPIALSSRLSLNALLLKAASGYWRLTDAQYGVIALRVDAVPESKLDDLGKTPRALPLLCELGLRQSQMLHLDIIDPISSAGGGVRGIKPFAGLMMLFVRRIAVQYFVLDVNLATIYLLLGLACTIGALCFGAVEWYESSVTGVPRSAGTVMLALLPLLMGIQLILNAILYDVQFASESVAPFALSRQPARKR